MLFAAPSQKVRPQMWGCDGERRHKCEFAMHGLLQYTTQRVNIWQFYCNLLTDLQNIEIEVIKRMAKNCVKSLYIIYYKKRAQSHRLHWWDFIDDKCLTLFTLKAKIWLRVTIQIIRFKSCSQSSYSWHISGKSSDLASFHSDPTAKNTIRDGGSAAL